MLRAPNMVSWQVIGSTIARSEDTDELRLAQIQLCKLRKKLPEGVVIATVWGEGVYLSTAGAQILKKMIVGGAA